MHHKRCRCLAGSKGNDREISDDVRFSVPTAHIDRKRHRGTSAIQPKTKLSHRLYVPSPLAVVAFVFKTPNLVHHFDPFLRLHVGQRACMSCTFVTPVLTHASMWSACHGHGNSQPHTWHLPAALIHKAARSFLLLKVRTIKPTSKPSQTFRSSPCVSRPRPPGRAARAQSAVAATCRGSSPAQPRSLRP